VEITSANTVCNIYIYYTTHGDKKYITLKTDTHLYLIYIYMQVFQVSYAMLQTLFYEYVLEKNTISIQLLQFYEL